VNNVLNRDEQATEDVSEAITGSSDPWYLSRLRSSLQLPAQTIERTEHRLILKTPGSIGIINLLELSSTYLTPSYKATAIGMGNDEAWFHVFASHFAPCPHIG
jgi:hypothetical protein